MGEPAKTPEIEDVEALLEGRDGAADDPAFREFKADWIKRRLAYLSRWGMVAGQAVNVFAIVTLLFFEAKNPRLIGFAHGAMVVFLAVWQVLHKRGVTWAPYYAEFGEVAMVAIYAVNLRLNVVNGVEDMYMIASSNAFMAASLLFALLLPTISRYAAFCSLIFVGLGVWCFHDQAVLGKWIVVHGTALVTMALFHYLFNRRAEHEAFLEYKMRQLIVERNEIERQKDLELAREVQESQFPAADLRAGNVHIHCYQTKYGTVCGDWMGIKTFDDGRTVAVVADATGHGVHAALVVQAVQTLWVDASAAPRFDARAWIERVNDALLRLGTRKLQTITLGLVEIGRDEIVYWSAGHVPLQVKTTGGEKPAARLLVARGNPLGLYREVELGSKAMPLPAHGAVEVMLGSDGVFANGTKYSERQVLKGFAALERDGSKFVEHATTEDDRSLIYLRVACEAASAA